MANNVMKAMYQINLSNDGRNDQERNMVNVNQERLNDNFRSISSALSDLFQSGEHTLKYLGARIENSEQAYVTTLNGVEERVNDQAAEILLLPDRIMNMVGYSIAKFNPDGDPVQVAVSSVINQQAGTIEARFSEVNSALGTIESWVRIYGVGNDLGIAPGVIIGDNEQPYALKAESNAIYFYRGMDSDAKKANMLAGFDASGSFEAGAIHNTSTLLDGKFDIDVVNANGVDFLHITGRS